MMRQTRTLSRQTIVERKDRTNTKKCHKRRQRRRRWKIGDRFQFFCFGLLALSVSDFTVFRSYQQVNPTPSRLTTTLGQRGKAPEATFRYLMLYLLTYHF